MLVPDTVLDVESGNPGGRTDGQDLIQAWVQQKTDLGVSASYVWNRTALQNVDTATTDYLLGKYVSELREPCPKFGAGSTTDYFMGKLRSFNLLRNTLLVANTEYLMGQ